MKLVRVQSRTHLQEFHQKRVHQKLLREMFRGLLYLDLLVGEQKYMVVRWVNFIIVEEMVVVVVSVVILTKV